MNSSQNEKTSLVVFKLAFAWIWVGIPLAWGVVQTMIKALGLFQ